MNELGFKISGGKALDGVLKDFKGQVARKIARGALIASAKPLTKAIKQNLKKHKRTGKAIKGIKAKSLKRGKRNRSSEVAVGVGPTKDIFYVRFLEFGTKNQKATPVMSPAIRQKKSEQQRILAREMSKRVAKEASKLAAKNRGRK